MKKRNDKKAYVTALIVVVSLLVTVLVGYFVSSPAVAEIITLPTKEMLPKPKQPSKPRISIDTTIPEKAPAMFPIIRSELDEFFPTIPYRNYVPALIEHESCISLTHSRCFSPTSRLKTQREEGAGLAQITRAYHEDGRLRFDALQEMKNRHPSALKGLNWSNVYQQPELQVRVLILKIRDDYNTFHDVPNVLERKKFTDASYNGGRGGVLKEQRVCHLTKGCNPKIWTNNVELHCLKSKKPLYAGRSACDINRHHVKDTFRRMPKYAAYMYNS